MTRYHTRTGSIYEVDGNRVRKVKGGAGRRVTEEWRECLSAELRGGRLVIYWGDGRDDVSDELGTPHDMDPSRLTVTSPVVDIEEEL